MVSSAARKLTTRGMGYFTVCSAAVLFRTQSHLPEPAGERTGEGSFHGADACSERGRRGRRRRHGLRCRAGRRSIELETSGMPPNTIQLDCRRTAFLTWKTGWLETNCFHDLENMLAADELFAHMVRAACLQMNGISTSKSSSSGHNLYFSMVVQVVSRRPVI